MFKEGELEELVEAKHASEAVSKSLLYYANRLKPKKATQILADLKRPYDKNGIRVTDPLSCFNHFFES